MISLRVGKVLTLIYEPNQPTKQLRIDSNYRTWSKEVDHGTTMNYRLCVSIACEYTMKWTPKKTVKIELLDTSQNE